MRQLAGADELRHHGRHAASAVIVLAEKAARGLHIHQQRNRVTDALPIVWIKLDADMAGDGIEVDRRVGGAADRRADDDGVLEGGAGHDVRRLEILAHHLHDALAREIGDLAALLVRGGDGGAARQHHAERLGQ